METIDPKKRRGRKPKQRARDEAPVPGVVPPPAETLPVNVIRIDRKLEPRAADADSLGVALDGIQGVRPYLDDLYDLFWNVYEDAKDPVNKLEALEDYKLKACLAYVEVAHGVRLVERALEKLLRRIEHD